MAVQKLKNVDHVDVLVSTWGYSDSVVLPLLKNSGILHFSAHRWKDVPQDFSFCAGDSIDTAVRALIALLNARGIKKVAWFSVAEQGEENYRLALVEALAKTDIKMVASLSAPAGVRDFRTWLMKLPASGAQTILDMGAIPQGEIIRRQARELQLGIPFISLSPAIKDAAPSLIEGSPLVYSAAATAEFAARYKAEYGKDEYYPVAQFYNAFDLIVRASEGLDGRKPTLKDLTTSLGQIKDFEGANGPLHFVPPTRFESPLSYFIFHNGVAVPTTLEELSKK
jgi:ABC-type branched-subunit amino acid transport system substrate-binding protein